MNLLGLVCKIHNRFMITYDSDDGRSTCCQPPDDSDMEHPRKVARKKEPSKRCSICGEAAFGEATVCLDCREVHAASLATLRVAINKLSGVPVLTHMPTIRGDMLVGDVKQVYMFGLGKTNPKDVQIVPAAPAGFVSASPMEDHQAVGLHGEEVHVIALSQ